MTKKTLLSKVSSFTKQLEKYQSCLEKTIKATDSKRGLAGKNLKNSGGKCIKMAMVLLEDEEVHKFRVTPKSIPFYKISLANIITNTLSTIVTVDEVKKHIEFYKHLVAENSKVTKKKNETK